MGLPVSRTLAQRGLPARIVLYSPSREIWKTHEVPGFVSRDCRTTAGVSRAIVGKENTLIWLGRCICSPRKMHLNERMTGARVHDDDIGIGLNLRERNDCEVDVESECLPRGC
jgi:hypothetical protein